MNTNNVKERGQAIVLIAAAIIGLVALTGLAIDGGNAFSDRRHAQNAADTAVVAAALTKTRGSGSWYDSGIEMAKNNGYDDVDANTTITLHACNDESAGVTCPAPYDTTDAEQYIHIVIESRVNTYFAPVVGITELNNRVEAIARAKPATEMFDGNAMISVCTDGKATFETNGGPATTVTGGGIFVNSNSDDCAFKVNGGSGSFTVPEISVVGEACYPEGTIGGVVPSQGVTPLPVLDYYWLDEAIACNSAPIDAYTLSETTITINMGSGDEEVTGDLMTPSYPVIRISDSFPVGDVIALAPGIYCLQNTFRINNTGAVLVGSDVTFVMLNKGLTMNGGYVKLSAPIAGPTAGLLFYQPVGNNINLAISGNTTLELTGTIIAPGAEVAIAGTPGTIIDGQVIGCEIAISGDSGGIVNYDDEKNIDDPPQIELIQ